MQVPSSEGALGSGNKLYPYLVTLLVLFIVLGGYIIYYITEQSGYDKQYLAIAVEQQLLSQRLATYSLEAASGKDNAFKQLKHLRDTFEQLMTKLKNGDSATGLPAAPLALKNEVNQASLLWKKFRTYIDTIFNGRQSIISVNKAANAISDTVPGLLSNNDALVNLLVGKEIDARQIYIAARQSMIAQRIDTNLNRIRAGGDMAAAAADTLGRDVALFGRVLQGLLKGDAAQQISKLNITHTHERLMAIKDLFKTVEDHTGEILKITHELVEINNAANDVERVSSTLLEHTLALEKSLSNYGTRLDKFKVIAFALGGASIVVMVLLGYLINQNSRKRLEVTAETNRRNQRAILRLLDEMTNLAEGDLTVHATVTEDITGAIADSVNYSIDALRKLVTTINQTAFEVARSAEKTQSTGQRLADASGHQAREIATATAAITDMAESIEQVSKNAIRSAQVALKSVEIAHKGAQKVSRTIDGMSTIREQIQETSKRIKRLGESSQEIGDIVSLINEIADQTNILALNAAIQASTAGEAGRGFAVVADEVQRLAERASNATKQIEALVKTIQTDTNEAVISMEQSTSNVVGGAKLAEDAGESLSEIEAVSKQLAVLIQSISRAARQQSSAAANITNNMNVIQEITMQTSEGSNETAYSIGNLTGLANELRQSVSGFKLPEASEVDTVVLEQ
jgi:twitching motility protein PilJ